MKKQYKKVLAAVLAVSLAWNLIPNIPYAHAGQTPHYIVDDIETLPDDILYQQVEFGTKKKDLELPNKLEMLVRPDDEEDWDVEYIETATSSNADKATPSDAEKTDEEEDGDEVTTPSTATSSNAEDTDGDWRMVRVEWVLNERFSEAAEYDGEQPGIYVFDAEFANDRYSVGDALLPTIEVEVLEEVQEQPVKRAPLAVQEQAAGGTATITAFTGLSDEVKAQELAIGASETEITLPDTLEVTLALQTEDSVDGGTGDEINVELTGIEWKIDEEKSSAAEFSSDASASGNKYVYVPVLPETVTLEDVEYTLEPGDEAKTPEITVTIGEKANNMTVARVEKNGETEEFSDITKAFESVAEGETATITLLNDAEIGEPGYIYVYGTVTLEGGEYTLSGSYPAYPMPGMLIVTPEAKLTINSGNYKNTVSKYQNYSIAISVYGELVFNDGTIIAESDENSAGSWGIYVNQNGSAEINGGTVSGLAPDREGIGVIAGNGNLTITSGMINGSLTGAEISYGSTDTNANISGGTFSGQYGLYVNYGGGTLTGGTFTGSVNAVFCNEERTEIRAGGLLGKGYTYYVGEDVSGTLAYGVNAADAALPAGTYTVGECSGHSYGAWSSADSKVHTRTCEYCGMEETTENHQFGEDGKCTVDGCTAQALVSVTVDGQTKCYTDISEAFSAASTAGMKAEVKLLADIDYGSWSYISVLSGDITLDLNGYTLTGKNQNQVLFLENCQMTIKDSSDGKTGVIRNMNGKGVFVRRGASLTVESGRIETNPESESWVYGTAINVAWGGSLTIYDGELDGYVGVHLDEGSVTIHGGSISGSWYAFREINKQDNVTLYGGTYTGGLNTKNITFAQILGEGRAYYDTETGSFLTEGLNQTGELAVGKTVSIQAAPVQITDGPEDLNLSYGFASGTARLQVTAVKGEAVEGELSYQWYQVSTEGGGTDKVLTDSEDGYAGSQTSTLILPDSWVSGGSGSFYCVVSCDGYSVSSGTAQVEIAVCPHSQVTDGVCQGCGRFFEASVSDGTGSETSYYENFEDAWEAAQGRTAEVRFLANAEVSATLTVTSGSNITLASETDSSGNTYTLSGNVFNASSGLINIASGGTLTLESGTVENGAGGNNAIAVNGGHFVLNGGTAAATADGHSGVCVYNRGTAEIWTGNVSGDIGVAAASDGSTITILDGTISGRASGVYVSGSGAKITITGGSISASNIKEENGADGAALRIQRTGSALLSGGTYSGAYGILIDSRNSITLKELLDADGDVKYAYYSNGELVTEGLDGKTLTGSMTVGECKHSYKTWTANEDGKTHSGTCVVCGDSISADHSWDENGKCTAEGCTAQAVASVTVNDGKPAYYPTIEEAWQAAKGHSEGGATVTLLANAEIKENLKVENGDNITLSMADGVTLTTSDSNGCILVVYGGRLTLESGALDAGMDFGTDFGEGIRIYGGTFIMNGGTVSGYIGIEQFSGGALDYDGGFVSITNGTVSGTMYGFAANGGSTELTGGTFSGSGASIINVKGKISDILGNGYAYKQDDAWVNDTTVTELTGTVTVEETPLQNVSISPATTTITYGDTAPTLTATAVQPEGSTNDVIYQWYLDGEKITGATGETYTPDKLDAREYAYTCTATVDGYSLPGTAATVKVEQRELELVIIGDTTKTYDETTDAPAGLSIEIQNVVSGDDVTVTAESYTYNSANVKEANTITAGGVTLSGADADNYKLPEGSVSIGGTITKSTPVITYKYGSVTTVYSGEAYSYYRLKDDFTVDGASFENIDFSCKDSAGNLLGSNPVDAGTYIIIATIAETDNTAGATCSVPLYIAAKTIYNPIITLEKDSYEYDGTEKKPTVKVFDGDTEIAPKEYTVTYSNNVNVGTDATVTITGAEGGNYEVSGSNSKTFEITKPDFSTATVTLEQTRFTYDGTAKTPGVTVIKNGKTLKKDTDYTVTYANNVNVGTASVTITAVENGNYVGSQTVTFEITSEEDIISVAVTWGAMEFTYTDGAWNPETHTYRDGGWTAENGEDQITVKNNGNTDVTVSYSYEKTETDISGSFADETGQPVEADTPIALSVGQERKTYLKLSGKPASGFTTGTLGTVKVTIGGEE